VRERESEWEARSESVRPFFYCVGQPYVREGEYFVEEFEAGLGRQLDCLPQFSLEIQLLIKFFPIILF